MIFALYYSLIKCVTCGLREFRLQTGPRLVKHCSNACRQKAYRQRKKIKNDNKKG